MATQYSRGVALERAVRAHLRDNGYDVVRSAGSKSPIDLVAIKPGQVVLIQCKLDGRTSPAEREGLLRIARAAGDVAAPIVAFGTPTHIDYARLTGTGALDHARWTPDEVAEVTP